MTREEAIWRLENCLDCTDCFTCGSHDNALVVAVAALREQEELADLIEARNEGRLVVLPCKLGADIFRLGAKEVCAHWQTAYANVYPDEIVMVDDSDNFIFIEDIGKTVFLTREEAEKALKEDA